MYRSTTCVWKFNTEADLRIVLGVTDITKDATDTITLRDSNGDILPTTSVAVGTREGFKIVTSTGNSLSIQLDTDDSSNDEEIYIYVISGVDSGTCPGNSKISATDEYQIITSSNFPDNYNRNEVCTVSITADENKVISYEILFKQIQDSTEFPECEEIFEVFDDVNECLEKNCSPRDICFEPESLNEFECNGHAETTEKHGFGRRTTFEGPLTKGSDVRNRISIDSSMKVILTTDNNFNKMERFTVSVISGRDSGTCPGSKTIQATDSFQTITSANFPESYGLDGDCDVTITADEGMVIVFSFPVLIIDEYRDICRDYLTLSTAGIIICELAHSTSSEDLIINVK
uniref:CUB domain-containing protein n=1 Tax=Magallana gigas TaxID=29159 RepID=K1RF01_MAGGI